MWLLILTALRARCSAESRLWPASGGPETRGCLRVPLCSRRLFGALLLARISQEVPFEAIDEEFQLRLTDGKDLKHLQVGGRWAPLTPCFTCCVHPRPYLAEVCRLQLPIRRWSGPALPRLLPCSTGRGSVSGTPHPACPSPCAAGGGGALWRRLRRPGRAVRPGLRAARVRHQICRGERCGGSRLPKAAKGNDAEGCRGVPRGARAVQCSRLTACATPDPSWHLTPGLAPSKPPPPSAEAGPAERQD